MTVLLHTAIPLLPPVVVAIFMSLIGALGWWRVRKTPVARWFSCLLIPMGALSVWLTGLDMVFSAAAVVLFALGLDLLRRRNRKQDASAGRKPEPRKEWVFAITMVVSMAAVLWGGWVTIGYEPCSEIHEANETLGQLTPSR